MHGKLIRKLELADDAIGNRSHDSTVIITYTRTARRILLTIVNEKNCGGAARVFIGYPHKFIE